MKIEKYTRRPFDIDAVQVTKENMEEVAGWCSGTVEADPDSGRQFIKVDTKTPLNDRQTQAHIKDWVLFAAGGYKIYTPKAFERNFVKKGSENAPGAKKPSPRPQQPPHLTQPALSDEQVDTLRSQLVLQTTTVSEDIDEAQAATDLALQGVIETN